MSAAANSFTFAVGAAYERKLTSRIGLRLLQLDYQRTGFPNNGDGWQSHLRYGAGVTIYSDNSL